MVVDSTQKAIAILANVLLLAMFVLFVVVKGNIDLFHADAAGLFTLMVLAPVSSMWVIVRS
jgi:ABC-type multidrug transport system permease subunit